MPRVMGGYFAFLIVGLMCLLPVKQPYLPATMYCWRENKKFMLDKYKN
jgi:hypothetical protein